MEAIVGDTAAAVEEQATPAFTADDEAKELASLTVKEITDVEKDLLGVTADVGGLLRDSGRSRQDQHRIRSTTQLIRIADTTIFTS